MSDCVLLMVVELNIRSHHREGKSRAIELTGTDTVEKFVILLYDSFTALRIFEYPRLESFANIIGFTLYDTGSIYIHHTLFLCIAQAVRHFDRLVDLRLLQIQQMLKDVISVHLVCAVLLSRKHRPVGRFVAYMERVSVNGILNTDDSRLVPTGRRTVTPLICRSLQQLIHELLIVFRIKPSSTELNVNISGFQRFRHSLFQRRYIDIEIGIILSDFLSFTEFLANIARKVLRSRLILVLRMWNLEDLARQVVLQLVLGHTCQSTHVLKVNPCFLRNGERECFKCCINVFHSIRRHDSPLCENIGLFKELSLIIALFQSCHKIVGHIFRKITLVGLRVDKPELLVEIIVCHIQLCLQILNNAVRLVKFHCFDQLTGEITKLNKCLETLVLCSTLVKTELTGSIIFLEEDLIVRKEKAVITQFRRNLHLHTVSRFRIHISATLMTDLRRQLSDRFMERRSQVKTVLSDNHSTAAVELITLDHCTKHHIRVLFKVFVDRQTVSRFTDMNPIGNIGHFGK